MPNHDPDYSPTNREKSIAANKAKFWCMTCDHALVGEHGKCPYCGEKDSRNKKKQ